MTTVAVAGGYAKTQQRGVVSLAASGIVLAAVPGKRLKVYTFSLQSRNDNMTAQFTDGAGGTNLGHVWTLNAREGMSAPVSTPATFIFATSPGTALYAVLTGAGIVDFEISYWADDAV